MQIKTKRLVMLRCLVQIVLACAFWQSHAFAENTSYQGMAPLNQYLMPEESEITLARSATPQAISADAEVMLLGRKGYTIARKGGNGFLCLVERSWGAATTDPEFWNPHVRGPICFNPPAARTYAPIYLMKTQLALASAFNKKELPALEPGAMSYMMSKQQYLSGADGPWHPHLMFFVLGDIAKSRGANLPGSPIFVANDPEERRPLIRCDTGSAGDALTRDSSDTTC